MFFRKKEVYSKEAFEDAQNRKSQAEGELDSANKGVGSLMNAADRITRAIEEDDDLNKPFPSELLSRLRPDTMGKYLRIVDEAEQEIGRQNQRLENLLSGAHAEATKLNEKYKKLLQNADETLKALREFESKELGMKSSDTNERDTDTSWPTD